MLKNLIRYLLLETTLLYFNFVILYKTLNLFPKIDVNNNQLISVGLAVCCHHAVIQSVNQGRTNAECTGGTAPSVKIVKVQKIKSLNIFLTFSDIYNKCNKI